MNMNMNIVLPTLLLCLFPIFLFLPIIYLIIYLSILTIIGIFMIIFTTGYWNKPVVKSEQTKRKIDGPVGNLPGY